MRTDVGGIDDDVRQWSSGNDTVELTLELAPGAVFEVPACFVGCFSGDWDEAGYVTQRFAERYIHPPPPDDNYPWAQYNSWHYEQNIDETQQLEAIERAAELGLELAVIDLGWAIQIGEWRHNSQKFPRGLRPLADRAHELGLRFGVHMALAQAAPASRVACEHPDWLIHEGDDYFGAAPLCLGHRPCREWLIGEILRVVDDYGIDYITQDGEDMVKWCPRTDHKDLFDKAGLEYPTDSWTWDDMQAAATQLTIREGDNVTQWGMDMGALSIWWGLQTLSWAQNDAFFDKELEPTKFQMTNPANVTSMQFVQDLIWKAQIAPNAAQRTAVGQDVGIFQSGRTALIADGSWSIANFGSLPFKWDIAPLPKWQDTRVVPYWLGGWVITKGSKVPQEAFNYANWSATEFQDQMAKDHDWIPLQNAARSSQDMLASMPSGFQSALDAISNAKIGDMYHRNSQQILNEVLGPIFTQVWENQLKPEDAAAQIDEKANALLAK